MSVEVAREEVGNCFVITKEHNKVDEDGVGHYRTHLVRQGGRTVGEYSKLAEAKSVARSLSGDSSGGATASAVVDDDSADRESLTKISKK